MTLFLQDELPKLEEIIAKYNMDEAQERFFRGLWLHIFIHENWDNEREVWQRAELRYVAKYGNYRRGNAK